MAPFQGFVMVECVSLRDFPGVHRALTWYRTRREATARLAVIMETYPESPSGTHRLLREPVIVRADSPEMSERDLHELTDALDGGFRCASYQVVGV
jgi:hypothetical protein